jgi:surface protein
MSGMFANAVAFNSDISSWDVSSGTNMGGMFSSATVFNQDIGSWDMSAVTNMGSMFSGAAAFNQDIGSWDVGSVSNMGQLFKNATSFNGDVSNWDVSSVTHMTQMFQGATSFDQDLGGWDMSGATSVNLMFSGATLSTANYDSLLIGWSALTLQPNLSFSGGNSHYCAGDTARQAIIDDFNWTIADAGKLCETEWTGNVSSDWFVAGNWTAGVPTVIHLAFIPDVSPNPFPVINMSGATCKYLESYPSAMVTIQTTGVLTVVE